MISNSITIFRALLILPFFGLLAFEGPGWFPLTLFLLIGGLDIADGKVARHLGESSALGAVLDLMADRLLTLASVSGLLVVGHLPMVAIVSAIILVGRDLTYATLENLLPPGNVFSPSRLETPKIVFAFAGLGLAIAPQFALGIGGLDSQAMATTCLLIAAVLSLLTIASYFRQTQSRHAK